MATYPGSTDSVIECSNFASITNKEMATEHYVEHAVNAFKFDKVAQTCVIGRIPMINLGDIPNREALISEQTGTHILQGCYVQGKDWQ